jgi:hypothetical protein
MDVACFQIISSCLAPHLTHVYMVWWFVRFDIFWFGCMLSLDRNEIGELSDSLYLDSVMRWLQVYVDMCKLSNSKLLSATTCWVQVHVDQANCYTKHH